MGQTSAPGNLVDHGFEGRAGWVADRYFDQATGSPAHFIAA
jgi:hypothetical protein